MTELADRSRSFRLRHPMAFTALVALVLGLGISTALAVGLDDPPRPRLAPLTANRTDDTSTSTPTSTTDTTVAGNAVVVSADDRRPGDIAASYADPALAESELGWRATRTVDDMCADTWRWQSNNPHGYPEG